MRTKFNVILTLMLALVVQLSFAQGKVITGVVTETGTGEALPGVNIVVKGTNTGATTDFDGKYTIKADKGQTLEFSYVGYNTVTKKVGDSNVINVQLKEGSKLEQVVVTALGIKREEKTLSYAAQQVKQKELNVTHNDNIKTAIAGKVAGVQINGQAGSKLGKSGKIRIRGAISLTSDDDPLYVLDGVPIDNPNDIDMDNIASVDVLKGPTATALYGQRAASGVVVLQSIKAKKGAFSVELGTAVTMDKVAYLPKYQNEYGQGYDGEDSFVTFNPGTIYPSFVYPTYWLGGEFTNQRYLYKWNNYADESWGPKFDGEDYMPWYAWWPDSPYYGQTAKYVAQPNNVKDFFNTGVYNKSNVAISGGGDKFTARFAYSRLNVNGIIPSTDMSKNYVNSNFSYDITPKLKVTLGMNLTYSKIHGDFNDDYGNQTTGSFNSWFGRQLDTKKMRELKDLTTPDGYTTSWNWWGPDYYAAYGNYFGIEGFKKPAFWYNAYTWLEHYDNRNKSNKYTANLGVDYKINDHWNFNSGMSRYHNNFHNQYKLDNFLARAAAPDLYNPWQNGFGVWDSTSQEDNYHARIGYKNKFENFDVQGFVGGNIRKNNYYREATQMVLGVAQGGLVIPDVYIFNNASEIPVTRKFVKRKQVNSLYSKLSVGYKDFLYLDATYRQDWSSALPANHNGYGYPSVGLSFLVSKLLEKNDVLSFAKLRASWGQVGDDVDALKIDPGYSIGTKPIGGSGSQIYTYTPGTLVDPNIKPALNTATEFGTDLKFFKNRIGFNFTYYDEVRTDEIIPISISNTTGYTNFLTNAGEIERKGVEFTLNGDIFKADRNGFNWNMAFNFGKNKTMVNRIREGVPVLQAPGVTGGDITPDGASNAPAFSFVTLEHKAGEEWGQLKGTGYKRDADGNIIINANGTYAVQQNVYFGSVLPDFTGGFLNSFSYKGVSLTAAIDFQKGGKFFSLSEMWGTYTGLYAETAGNNDKGNPKRDAVADGGGVHITGVKADGSAYDNYIDTHDWASQWYGNRLAEPFIHDASYIKLREVALSYDFPKGFLGKAVKGASVGLIGRNLLMIAVAKDNVHGWDPSELAQTYGENGQLPGTRSFGMNLKIKF